LQVLGSAKEEGYREWENWRRKGEGYKGATVAVSGTDD